MAVTKLTIWNERMLQLMMYCKSVKLVKTQKAFCEAIGFNETNIKQIRAGAQSFTHEHCYAACTNFGISMNWIYGFEDEMFRAKTDKKTFR